MKRPFDIALMAAAAAWCVLGCTSLNDGTDLADGSANDAGDGSTPDVGMDAAQTEPGVDAATDGSHEPEPKPDSSLDVDGALSDAEMETACEDGFELDGETCVDIDECFLDLDICHPTATCQNVDGGYDCGCPQGYVGGGSTNIACSPRVAAGISHSCVVLANGRVSCWGANDAGQLGDGTRTTQTMPTTVLGVSDAVAVRAGASTSCALIADGTVTCWGSNRFRQLADAVLVDSDRAVAIEGVTDIVSLDVGQRGVCAISGQGQVLCWGANDAGQLGDGSTSSEPIIDPVEVSGLMNARAISVGWDFACATLANGTLRCWGGNAYAQLGTGETTPSATPVAALDIADVSQIDTGLRHSCALLGTQRAKCWGLNTPDRVTVYDLYNATELAVGSYNSCAVHTARSVVTCWLFYDARPEEGAFEVSLAGDEALALAMGGDDFHACVVVDDGRIRCWGNNGSGQLGDGTTTTSVSGATVHVMGIDLW